MKFQILSAMVALALPACAQYAGPAILARGEAPSVITLPEIRFSPYVSLGGTYDSGLATIAVSDKGQLASASSYGATITWGVSGAHSFRSHTRLGIAYNGSYDWYVQHVLFNGMSHNFMLGISHQFSRRFSVEWRQTAGMYTRNYATAGLVETVPFDPSSAYIPTTDFFDNRTIYLSSQLTATYSLSKRLSMHVGGAFFADNRQSHALTSNWGTQETGDLQYRLNARTTVGGGYSYMHFGYAHYNGGTDAHVVQGSYSIRLSRLWEFSGYGGIMRIESKYLTTIPVDPAIQALFGITQSVAIGHFTQITPTFSGRLARSFHRGVAYVSGGRTITPGNGFFLTSVAEMVTGGYDYSGFHRWSLNANVAYVRATAEGGGISGEYGNLTETLSAGRQFLRSVGFHASVALRRYSSGTYTNYNRDIKTASVGIYYSPGLVRLPTW